ncbi:MAG: SDR family oxidoreductase [Ilumatobacteraceae bacterium]
MAAGDAGIDGSVAIVTGAGRGLGRHVASALAARGFPVAAVGRAGSAVDATVAAIEAGGGVALPIHADVLDDGAASDVVRRVEAELGPVGLLVNNAGTMHLGRIAEIDPDEWWTDFEVNVKATMRWCQAALAEMLPRRHGLIVNVASTATQWVVPAGSAYIASKAAVISLTKILAAELRGSGVRAFAFGPWARTDMTDGLATSPAFTAGQRAVFRRIDDAEAERRLRGTLRMLDQIIDGDLDDHLGEYLDSEAPPR